MKFRIRKITGYTYVHRLERESSWFGWVRVFTGTKEECLEALDAIKKSKSTTDYGVIHEEEVKGI